jgi:hypothetical protein
MLTESSIHPFASHSQKAPRALPHGSKRWVSIPARCSRARRSHWVEPMKNLIRTGLVLGSLFSLTAYADPQDKQDAKDKGTDVKKATKDKATDAKKGAKDVGATPDEKSNSKADANKDKANHAADAAKEKADHAKDAAKAK